MFYVRLRVVKLNNAVDAGIMCAIHVRIKLQRRMIICKLIEIHYILEWLAKVRILKKQMIVLLIIWQISKKEQK